MAVHTDGGMMNRSDARAVLSIMLVLAPLALLVAACSRPPEQQMLTQFFRAARGRDSTTTAMMSAVTLDPRQQGAVEDFTITSVGPEVRAPLDFSTLLGAEQQAREAEQEFQRQKKGYSDANLKTIEEILKLERDPTAKLTREQAAVKPIWDKWREDTAVYVKNASSAASVVKAATGPAEASLSQPGQPSFDPKAFKGETIAKDVSIKADFRSPEGEVSEKDLVVTMMRVVGTQGDTPREGKWIITRIAGL
jgi:hypothetical protein